MSCFTTYQGVRRLALVAVLVPALQAQSEIPFPEAIPLGLPRELPAPPSNPLDADRFALGKALFFDPILSLDRTVACASCHDPDHGYSTPIARPPGVGTRRALRHAPTLFNRGWGNSQRWDGKTPTLEEQVLLPIEDPNEMALPLEEAVGRLRESPRYTKEFARVFDTPPDQRTLSLALAGFVRGLLHGDTPVDRFQAGESSALTPSEKAGLWIYESKGRCWQCHSGHNFTDEGFHNTGVGALNGTALPGREAATGDHADHGRFKTPTLRGSALSPPYMHDGSIATLEEVVAFYARGGNANDHLDPKMAPLNLSEEDQQNLVAFLRAISRSATTR